jgi:hypothetical protein
MPDYTKEDMKVLVSMCEDGTVPRELIPELDYDSGRFKEMLIKYKQQKAITYLYEMPLEDLPLYINDQEVAGYIKYRFTVAK